MRELPLNAKAYATLDANGNGEASTGPQSPGERWDGINAAVSVATNANEATCSLYAGAAATPGYLQGATTWGSTGNSGPISASVRVGGNVFAVWTGGDPGAKATLTITGKRSVS
jgi:hypothetical protein